jgi:hypothetical protein
MLLVFLAAIGGCAPSFGDKPATAGPDKEIVGAPDADGDGFNAGLDCDDADAAINPGASEMCGDGIDNDCDGAIDGADGNAARGDFCYDGDGDGYCVDSNDDGDIDVVTLCDNADANAEMIATHTGGDADAVANYIEVAYGPLPDYALPSVDCDDEEWAVNPDAEEVCDIWGVDEDCDGGANEDDPDDMVADASWWYEDADWDGYGNAAVSELACEQPSGYVMDDTDCDDDAAGVNPGAMEVCDADNVDEDCDGWADDDDMEGADGLMAWYDDLDGDGVGAGSATMSCDAGMGQVASWDDCNDGDDTIYPGADELCDGLDNDCDGTVDEDPVDQTTWFQDLDGDWYGNSSVSFMSCDAPSGWVETNGDCDDSDASVFPGASELFNGEDDDCDGSVDEGAVCTVEIQILEEAGALVELTGVVSDDMTLSGEWYPGGVSGVSVTSTSLGGSDWEIFVALDVCISSTGSIILDGEFASGSLAEGFDNTFATLDGGSLTVSLYDNGDGTMSYEITQ